MYFPAIIINVTWVYLHDILLIAVPHPDVFWCHLNGIGTQKNTLKKVIFPYMDSQKCCT